MAYNSYMTANVIVGGRIVREKDGRIVLPFGTEYSIQLYNIHLAGSPPVVGADRVPRLPGARVCPGCGTVAKRSARFCSFCVGRVGHGRRIRVEKGERTNALRAPDVRG